MTRSDRAAAIPSVLVVDDNLVSRRLVRVVLGEAGYDVRAVADGGSALAAVAERLPDLVLMDVQMPGMDGLAVTRLLKDDPATAHIPVVALTAYAATGDEALAREAGCDAFIAKPIDTRRFPAQVLALLEARRAGYASTIPFRMA